MIFKIVGYVMYLAPLGAFGAMAATVGDYDAVWLITGVNAWKFIRYCRDEFMLALGTGSSEAAMPRNIDKLNKAGCNRGARRPHRLLLQSRRCRHLPVAGDDLPRAGGGANCLATFVVARWEGMLDRDQMRACSSARPADDRSPT